jgi:adenylate cyclase
MRTDRSFAFLDLCGFTAFADLNGDDEAVQVLGLFRKIVREVASDYAVRIDKWLGDGVMLVSVEPSPLVEAVLEIERRCDLAGLPLPLRGGVSRGDVILMDGDDYIGRAVNMAARLCSLAEPHKILTVAEIAETAWPSASFPDEGVHMIPGFAEPVAVFDIVDRNRNPDHTAAAEA